MKILYLLFPFFLLLIQGAAAFPMGKGSSFVCARRGGYCTFGRCRYPAISAGRCSRFRSCCRR
ncbi:spheniscin-1-like [Calonectris borealis]|uniref:spheniscin-1-like n=1 Tax=Calonectris borealis TaxID=1323832 RepID=UPI003F4C0B69